MSLTNCQSPANAPDGDFRRDAAAKYHALKSLGTVGEICQAFGISRPTLLKWAEEFPPENGVEGTAETSTPDAALLSEDGSSADPQSLPVPDSMTA